MTTPHEQIAVMSFKDKVRIGEVLNSIGHKSTEWAPAQYFDFWLVEHRMASERAATARLAFATWALVATTGVLVLATAALVYATLHHG
jgi:hypothetical protein